MCHCLTGRRVVVTRAEGQVLGLVSHLRALGAEPVVFPVIAIAPPEVGGPLDRAIAQLERYDWVVLTSANGVEHFLTRLVEIKVSPRDHTIRGRVAAVGPATAAALRQRGVPVHLLPDEHRAEAILDEIGDVAGQRILLPCADIARPTLTKGLRALGAQVDRVTAYRNVLGKPIPAAYDALRAGVDVLTFTSSSSVRNFLALTQGLDYGAPLVACIGPVTAATARELGLRVNVVPEEYTIEGLVEKLKAYCAMRSA